MATWWMPTCGKPPSSSGASEPPEGVFEWIVSREQIRKILRSWAFSVEPPIGIEPMTYALRAGSRALLAGANLMPASGSQVAAGGDRWLLTAVRGHLGDTPLMRRPGARWSSATAQPSVFRAYVPSMRRASGGYDRLVARRPSDDWRCKVEEQAAMLAQGSLSPDEAYASHLWPESLLVSTDAALAAFEDELHALVSPSDDDILSVVMRVVLVLNKINEQQGRAGQMGYETGEREELCDYIDASFGEAGIDVEALAARHGIGRWEITDAWRRW